MDRQAQSPGTTLAKDARSDPIPTGGELAFAWVFGFFYLTLMGVLIGAFAALVVGYFLKGAPQNMGFLLSLMVVGMLPHAQKLVAEELARTRGLPLLIRLGRVVATIHS